MGASLLAMRPHQASNSTDPKIVASHMKLAALSTESRRDVDYRLLDARLQQLMHKPPMVGLAVGVVENGRITFLKGYGETLQGSGDPVTPDTVRSEERRVGKECRARRWPYHYKKRE